MNRTIALQVKILSDDPNDKAPERIRMEVQRALALWLGPERVYVELDLTAEMQLGDFRRDGYMEPRGVDHIVMEIVDPPEMAL